MSKYEQLWKYIEKNAVSTLSFEEVERIYGFPIDHSFLTYKKELESYGYKVGKISLKNRTIKIEPWKED